MLLQERFAKDPTILDFAAPHSVVDFIGTKISDKPLSKEATLQHFNALMPEEKTLLLAMAQKELKPLYAKDKVNTDIRQLLAQTDIVEQFRTVNDKLDALDTKSSKILDNQDIMMDKLDGIDLKMGQFSFSLSQLAHNFDIFAEATKEISDKQTSTMLECAEKLTTVMDNQEETVLLMNTFLEESVKKSKNSGLRQALKNLNSKIKSCKNPSEVVTVIKEDISENKSEYGKVAAKAGLAAFIATAVSTAKKAFSNTDFMQRIQKNMTEILNQIGDKIGDVLKEAKEFIPELIQALPL